MSNVGHIGLSNSVEHYSPPDIVRAAREVLGTIDLDPASCATANTVIDANRFFTKEDDGLAQVWSGKVFVNPPGGKLRNKSNQLSWWNKLVQHWLAHDVRAAIFVAFNIELLQSSQAAEGAATFSALHFPLCIPRQRLSFFVAADNVLVPQTSPVRANAIIYLPERGSTEECLAFERAFSKFGQCIFPPFERWRPDLGGS